MKAVHWTVPFASLKGVQYRVDIYADGECATPIELMGGASPFTTDEDNDDNYFAPVRSQTGHLNVIDEDGTLMETLMPADNIDRPVRLVRVSDSKVMWQGFLSCEAYSQDYTARAQELTLNVNSVLAAMESVQMRSEDSGFKKIRWMLKDVFERMYGISGITIGDFVYPKNSYTILNKYIDTTVLFEQKEQDNENSVTYTVSGISLKEALERICTYMGWCVRECGDGFYFQEIGGGDQYYTDKYGRFRVPVCSIPCSDEATITTEQMSAQEWRGTGHEIELRQGAKSVEVVANVEEYDVSISIPDCPSVQIKEKKDTFALTYYYYYAISKYIGAYSNCVHKFRTKKYKLRGLGNFVLQSEGESNVDIFYNYFNQFRSFNSYRTTESGAWEDFTDYYYGAILSRCAIDTEQKTVYSTKNALVCCLCQMSYTTNNEIFSIESNKIFAGRSGIYLSIDLSTYFFVYSMCCKEKPGDEEEINMYIRVQIGDYYWDKDSGNWTTTPTNVEVKFNKDGLIGNYDNSMPFVEQKNIIYANTKTGISGKVKITIMECRNNDGLCDTIVFNDIKVGIKFHDDAKTSDRGENHYFQLLGLNFSDEVSVNTDIASDLNNKPSPSIIMNSETEPMTTLTYADGTSERPEKVLLNRLAAYYGAVRRKITLEIERPNGVLPMVKVTGFDEKTYLPLSESRDWRTDTSTVVCFEAPNP